jgi:hypothetical protein
LYCNVSNTYYFKASFKHFYSDMLKVVRQFDYYKWIWELEKRKSVLPEFIRFAVIWNSLEFLLFGQKPTQFRNYVNLTVPVLSTKNPFVNIPRILVWKKCWIITFCFVSKENSLMLLTFALHFIISLQYTLSFIKIKLIIRFFLWSSLAMKYNK